jgi:hypothetical protein
MGEALYAPDGDRFVPSVHTAGPWDPRAQHGGAPSALLARCVEMVDAPGPMHLARFTVELMRPVPLTPLRVETTVLRPGRKVQWVGASLVADDIEVARATALRIRTAHLPLPDGIPPADRIATPPEGATPPAQPPFAVGEIDEAAYHRTGAEVVFVRGSFEEPGPAVAWVRLRRPVVEGEAPSGVVRTAAAADFGNGVGWTLPADRWTFINADLTVYLHRPPNGEWVGLDATTQLFGLGVCLADCALHDTDGRIGRSCQALVLDSR